MLEELKGQPPIMFPSAFCHMGSQVLVPAVLKNFCGQNNV
jgi:hypothetical protein